MVKEIIKDVDFLQKTSDRFYFAGDYIDGTMGSNDEYLIQDMLDTAEHHKDNCIGLAAVQIGVLKRIIVVYMGGKFVPFINPVIIQRSRGTYMTKEGCLSLDGLRDVRRHDSIKVAYTTKNRKTKVQTFKGITAQIIQHEVDHLNGKLI